MVWTQLLVQLQQSSLGAPRLPKSRRSSGAERRNSLPLKKAELMLFNTLRITYTHTSPVLFCRMFWVTQDHRPQLWLMALFPKQCFAELCFSHWLAEEDMSKAGCVGFFFGLFLFLQHEKKTLQLLMWQGWSYYITYKYWNQLAVTHKHTQK